MPHFLQDVLVGLLIPMALGAVGWAWSLDRKVRALSRLPARVEHIDRRTLRILIRVDPNGAQDELRAVTLSDEDELLT
jgi:hypothetical protein